MTLGWLSSFELCAVGWETQKQNLLYGSGPNPWVLSSLSWTLPDSALPTSWPSPALTWPGPWPELDNNLMIAVNMAAELWLVAIMRGYLEVFVAKIVSDVCKIYNLQSIDLSETKFVVLCPNNKRTKKVLQMFIKRHILPGNFCIIFYTWVLSTYRHPSLIIIMQRQLL